MKKAFLLIVMTAISIGGWSQSILSEVFNLHDEKERILGGDASLLPSYEQKGTVYRDAEGNAVDALDFFKQNGWDCIRVRLFVNPEKAPGTHKGEGVCQDIDYVVKFGKQIKQNGMKLMLDFHYSDTWADPGMQWTPKAWENLTDEQPYTKIYEYTKDVLQQMKEAFGAKPGDLILILSGDDAMKTRKQLCELRLEMGNQLGLRDKNKFALLWVVDFPMFEWSDEENRLMAMHHPFTHPKDEDIPLLDTDPAAVRADAYDMVCNGIEVGGGSIRIHDAQLQAKMFEILGFTPERAQEQFGFLMNAFKYGAPPHGGLAYGLDRWVSLFAGLDSIRDCIAFPKNNSGRDVMLDAPGELEPGQLEELSLKVEVK